MVAKNNFDHKNKVIEKTRVPDSGCRVPGIENAGMENAGVYGKRG